MSNLTTIPAYIILALTFIYGYLKPKEYCEWLVVSSNTYLVNFVLMVFVAGFAFAIGLFLPGIMATLNISTALYILVLYVPAILIYLSIFLMIVKNRIQMEGGIWQVSFILFIYSLAQEVYTIIRASTPSGDLLNVDVFSMPGFWLLIWYMVGAFVVLIVGTLLGRFIDTKFKTFSDRHIPIMREKFGAKAPNELRFRDGSSAKGDFGPGFCVATGVVYCLWMILRHLLIPI